MATGNQRRTLELLRRFIFFYIFLVYFFAFPVILKYNPDDTAGATSGAEN